MYMGDGVFRLVIHPGGSQSGRKITEEGHAAAGPYLTANIAEDIHAKTYCVIGITFTAGVTASGLT